MNQLNNDMSILLVDDEEDIRDVLNMALLDAGYNVYLAESGRKALDIFEAHHPPIVITDIKMPGLDGIELLQQIKRNCPDTEVIMITGHGDMDLAILSLKYEASDFITKPINVSALEVALKRVKLRIVMRKKLMEYTTSLERLLKEKSELQDHLSSLGLMIGSISHGIKGLLTGLDGGMYLMERGLTRKDQEKITEGWSSVRVVVERIRKMMMDILFYAKKRELNRENTDVASFAKEVARMMAAKIKEMPINFTFQLNQNLGRFQIDPGYVHAALMNLFDNALDAIRRRESSKQHEIGFQVALEDQCVKLCVSDTGIGMDHETQSKLFTAFFSSKGRKGTGLGLFITHKIVEQHGGRIEVSSAPQRGSRFTILLPLTVNL